MRNPILSKLTKLSRLPSTNMEVRLDSTIDALPNVLTPSTFSSGSSAFGGTDETWASASWTLQTGIANINSSRTFYELTVDVSGNDKGRYAGYITTYTATPATYQLSNTPISNSLLGVQLEPYVYGETISGSTYPVFGVVDTGVSPSLPVSHLKLNPIGSTFSYSCGFMIKPGAIMTINSYFSAVEADEITGRYPSSQMTLTYTLKNITPGSGYGTICANCTATTSLKVS